MNAPQDSQLPLLAVLMAGGGGTRLWPLSRPGQPKQFLPLIGGRSLFQLTVARLREILPPENIFVISNEQLMPMIRSSNAGLPEANLLCEPSPRNTAPAAAYALAVLQARFPRFVMACLPSDHYIADTQRYLALVQAARSLAGKGFLVTLGIEPTAPATGYGYVEQGEPLESIEGWTAFRVRRFKEKPTADEAKAMLAQGGFHWNSGMFFWRSDVLAEEFHSRQPAIAQALDRMAGLLEHKANAREWKELWESMPSLSLDYGVLEVSDRVAVLPARGLGWTDIGSWDALVELYQAHPELQAENPKGVYDVDSQSVTVIRKTDSHRPLATVGLRDVIIVETDEAILICQRGKSQDVRKIAGML
jgi:mannose-1-phosphate guanylyltransferase